MQMIERQKWVILDKPAVVDGNVELRLKSN